LAKKVNREWKQAISILKNLDIINLKLKRVATEGKMKNIKEVQKRSAPDTTSRDWLRYELTEEDFLIGKRPEFSAYAWEDE